MPPVNAAVNDVILRSKITEVWTYASHSVENRCFLECLSTCPAPTSHHSPKSSLIPPTMTEQVFTTNVTKAYYYYLLGLLLLLLLSLVAAVAVVYCSN